MKHFLFLIPLLFVAACSSAPRPVTNSNQAATNANSQSKEVKSVIAHSSEGQQPSGLSSAPSNSNGAPGKWSRGGDPIDTSSYDANIESIQEDHRVRPSDDGTKRALAQAYFERGFALTEARQYASALGDYRRALKLDPNHEESKKWIAQIEGIYASPAIKKAPPKEGQEPPPLPFKKES